MSTWAKSDVVRAEPFDAIELNFTLLCDTVSRHRFVLTIRDFPGDREIDLVVNRDRPEQLINVAYSVSRVEAWDREIAALEWAGARFPRVPRALVAHERPTRKPPTGIRITDAWQYLLAGP